MTNRNLDFDCLSILKNERRTIKSELRHSPKGKLMIQKNHGKLEYFRVQKDEDGTRKRVWLGNDQTTIYKLAHKAYLEERLKRVEANIKLLTKPEEHWQDLSEQSIIGSLPKYYNTLQYSSVLNTSYTPGVTWPNPVYDGSVPIREFSLTTGSLDIDEWAARPYCANVFHPEHLKHRTSNGLLCRSKGEAGLIELCIRLGYRYHYDETITINGVTISPDLIIARADGSLIFVEHRGLHDDRYVNRNKDKDDLYFEAGIRLGKNYLVTFDDEDGGINLELVEMQLRDIVER